MLDWDQHVHTLQAQVEALQQHSEGQSKQILHLKQELEALKVRHLSEIFQIQGYCHHGYTTVLLCSLIAFGHLN